MMDQKYLTTAIGAAFHAGQSILKVYDADDAEITYKSDNSPLTLADRQSHRIIDRTLKPLGLPILSEEGRSIAHEQRRIWEMFWLVDPLDGTKEFIKRNGEFTVNIALIHQGQPVLGVVYVPVKDALYFAEKDYGAFKIDNFSRLNRQCSEKNPDSNRQTLIAGSKSLPIPYPDKSGYAVMGSRSHSGPEMEAYVERLKTDHPNLEFISAGSSLKLCLVAEGLADEYPRLGPTMEWDTAAGQAIAEGAGAKMVDYKNRQPLRYNKENLLNPWFIVFRAAESF